MPTSYLDLCNAVLRRLNEVPMTSGDWDTVRNVQALTKDCVKQAVSKINQQEFNWPFNAAQHTQTLTAGVNEYIWPDAFKVADYNSFQIQRDDSLDTMFHTLKHMDQDEYYQKHRDDDMNALGVGLSRPDYIIQGHGNGYIISPTPDKAYELRFRYYLNFADLQAYNDLTRIPTSFDSVIIDGALYDMSLVKNNTENATAFLSTFQQGIKDLQTLYINNYDYIRDTRIKF